MLTRQSQARKLELERFHYHLEQMFYRQLYGLDDLLEQMERMGLVDVDTAGEADSSEWDFD